jgi:sugar phosphate isomerase/epimerase
VGCQANGFVLKAGDFPGLLEAVRQMKVLGYAGFECNVRFVRDQFAQAARARREIQGVGLEFLGGHMSIQDATPEAFRGLASLGAHWAVVSSGGPWRGPDLDALAKTCSSEGLKFAYHNHNPEFANGNAVMEELAASTKLVSFLMDAGHGYLGGGDPAEFMRRHSERIVGCHIKTFKGKTAQGQVPLGQGDFGFEKLAAAIGETGWQGWLIDEEGGGPVPANTAALGPDREYIRRLFGV